MAFPRLFAAAATLLFFAAPPVSAQEGCKTVQFSCSQMNQRCERACQSGRDPSICIARTCSIAMTGCKSTGTWKSQVAGAACWKTNNRS
jgi:predicted secreted protein